MTSAKPFNVEPIDATFGAVITGLKLADLGEPAFAALYETWLEYALLVFPAQNLSNEDQITLARRFGDLELELAELSNVKKDGGLRTDDDDDMVKILKGNMGWHCDSTYMPVQAKGAVFTAHVVPAHGGETAWADTRAAYQELDAATRERIANMSAYHSLYHSQKKFGETKEKDSEYFGYGFFGQEPPLRPLVKIHPETGRPSLAVGRHAYGIPGIAEDESEKLLRDLVDFTCQSPRVYQHNWTAGDAVLWDNRCLMHRACTWDMNEPRVMFHSRIAGDPESEFAAHA
ncbi:MAG: TauD/TfdA family dioxygenase [Alphaproteobacteria bacterium]|nr:TauD/TfdA family dioxygenase [Alphaproteobacteria bacterium]